MDEIILEIVDPDSSIGLPIISLAEKGEPGQTQSFVIGEVPSGSIDGSNATFETAFNFVPESVEVYVNGLNQLPLLEFNTSGNRTIILTESPGMGERILTNYLRT